MKHSMTKLLAGAVIAVGIMSTPAVAQDLNASPTFGTIRLSEGFTPDPHTQTLTAGGNIDASRSRGGTCVGKIASAPDLKLNYAAGSSPLYIRVRSMEDTTLVINTADGRWFCDDDSGGGVDPKITIRNPPSGVYDIWVGTYGDNPVTAQVEISEIDN